MQVQLAVSRSADDHLLRGSTTPLCLLFSQDCKGDLQNQISTLFHIFI